MKKKQDWRLEDVGAVRVAFFPKWRLYQDNEPTSGFKGLIGGLEIALADFPEELQEEIEDFIKEVMESYEIIDK